ncbi:MAG: type II secretion system F family protein [Fimbriimonadaceae bacterium]|nr:type II secretion system F family protein [Fimbriimonadaceae bacterium]QYK57809.1 MAG: type II secretion system F family protein [Fimbriimonadaceae bacterium]
MPTFSYEAVDTQGRPTQGLLDASTENEAVTRLSGQGLRVTRLVAGSAPVPRQPLPAQTAPVAIARPSARAQPPSSVVRTPRASYRDRSFFFSQLALLWRSGVPLATALGQLASAEGVKPHIREAAANLARTVSEGGTLGREMTRYPDIFPEGVAGAVAAGEAGGYVPEACKLVADQQMASHKAAWGARILRWICLLAAISVPWGVAMTVMMRRFVDTILNDLDAPTNLPARLSFMGQEFWKAMFGLPGLALGLFIVAYVILALWLKSTGQRRLRHSLGLLVPVYSRFAKGENLAHFTWHLGMLSRAGLAPQQAWRIAAQAVPNQAFSARLAEASARARENTPYGELLAHGDLMPPEYADLVRTGEYSGAVTDAFDQTSRLAQADMEHWAKFRGWLLRIVAAVVLGTTTLVVVSTFFAGTYSGMIEGALRED